MIIKIEELYDDFKLAEKTIGKSVSDYRSTMEE